MIYTVTFNPSLDYIVAVDDFKPGYTNRTNFELLLPGGKGINVSTVLKNLGIASVALGFVAGFSGAEIVRKLAEMGVQNNFINLPNGFSRINLKLKNIDGTEINGQGPDIGEQELAELLQRLDKLTDGDVLFLSGSIPATLPNDIYQRIMQILQGKEVAIVVDATGELLLNVLAYKPFLIKPNKHELSEIFGVELKAPADVVPYARKLQEQGARNVLISMGGEGAVLVSEKGEVFAASAPRGELKNAVGAGDSMVAGFMAGYIAQKDYTHAFYMGLAAGSASAFSENLATAAEIELVYRQVRGIGK